MFKKTVTYVDYDGVERTEDFFFHLTQAEALKLNFSEQGGLQKTIEKIIAENDQKRIIEIMEKLVLEAYGEKSPDGRRFMKTPEIKAAFAQTEAFSDIFMELATDAEAAAEFVNGITPKVAKLANAAKSGAALGA